MKRMVYQGLLVRLIMLSLSLVFFELSCVQPKISIITSMKDGEYFIAPFLADIVRQTVFAQCELIIINVSPRGEGFAKNIIHKYRAKYPQIIYQRLPQDPGLYAVWNKGIKLARGVYVTNANLDDRLAPDCYEVHARVLDENPAVDLVYSNSHITRLPNETFECNSAAGLINHPEFYPDAIKKGNLPSFNPMWRKNLHEKYGYFDPAFRITGDWEMWVRAIVGGAKFKKATGIHGLFYYNTKGLSLDRSTFTEQRQERERVQEKYPNFFAKE